MRTVLCRTQLVDKNNLLSHRAFLPIVHRKLPSHLQIYWSRRAFAMKVALIVATTVAVGSSIVSSEKNFAFVGAPRARLGAAKAMRSRSTSRLQMKLWDFGLDREVCCVFSFECGYLWSRLSCPITILQHAVCTEINKTFLKRFLQHRSERSNDVASHDVFTCISGYSVLKRFEWSII